MLLSARTRGVRLLASLGAGAIAGAMLFGALPSAMADDPGSTRRTAPPPISPAWRQASRRRRRRTCSPIPT